MVCLVSATVCPAAIINRFACSELSAFCRVMAAISSTDAEVSSRELACSEAPSANVILAFETCEDAAVNSFEEV